MFRLSLAITLALVAFPADALDTDATLIFGSAALDVASTQYVRTHHAPNAVVSDINPFCETLVSCSAVNLAGASGVYLLARQQRKAGHVTRARVVVWTWTAIKVAAVAVNVRNSTRTR